ncbi:MAG: tRNA pseudouridine(55) synthase TruB [Verrucomicrobiota bacterium]|jgi:tRNA pseudouridine55 synthase|nr:tRNA pseudouridine(55) synthase TruB [Verrucomicrobiota bacterium]MDP6251203.1 tRNA pseudouridine(55) synthase TruB [Verrucomicrobiota bacterium]MDP7177618.1 tRNA pseudouridine(55) synthase TruB [Verrucomicrobiota bacterium]MDP7292946.1 tRNA pseudouridine(55) synthase TruB [Verrucomicrobiota bacterium]HJN83016.1 tRNA pseudouridine(55) synthase TruB [Verrucomicrobiota bacterium]|tara:strand:- start:2148 stop:2876 length:729 start_codon:yes stop_codon:yes gene_type:complete
MSRQAFDALDGALLIDKTAGPTSHDIVDTVRQCYRIKKVGHCGTLDPAATGLLVLLLGKATKLSEKLMADDKVYVGSVKLGETTNTFDAEGEIDETMPVPDLTLEGLQEKADDFLGDQLQLPPMVSAIKIDGTPLYKLARKGMEIERRERFIHLYKFQISEYEPPYAWFKVACTKGTYVRTLAHDLGQALGCGAHLAGLRRTVSGNFKVGAATRLEELTSLSMDDLAKRVVPMLQLSAATEP